MCLWLWLCLRLGIGLWLSVLHGRLRKGRLGWWVASVVALCGCRRPCPHVLWVGVVVCVRLWLRLDGLNVCVRIWLCCMRGKGGLQRL